MQKIQLAQAPIRNGSASLLVTERDASKTQETALLQALERCVPFASIKTEAMPFQNSFDAKMLFEQGRSEGRKYEIAGETLVIADATADDNLNALAVLESMHIETIPLQTESVLQRAGNLAPNMGLYEKFGVLGDPTLVYLAGFILEASRRAEIVLLGDIRMVTVLLIADKLATRHMIPHDPRHISLWTDLDEDSAVFALLEALIDRLNFRPKTARIKFGE